MVAAVVLIDDAGADAPRVVAQNGNRFDGFKTQIDVYRFLAGAVQCETLLIGAEYVDAEIAGILDHLMRVGALGDRNDTERRLERTGHEGVCGHGVRRSVDIDGDHRNPGGEAAHRLAKQARHRSCRPQARSKGRPHLP